MAKQNTKADAVMARRRKRDDNEGLTEEERQWKKFDFYGSPPWSARAGAEVALELWPRAKVVREPACGMMSMAGPFEEHFAEVLPTDVFPYTPNTPIKDFFDHDLWPAEPDCDLILTNPPFILAADFLRLSLKRVRLGVGMLVRTVWVESEDRYSLFEGGPHPLTCLCPFSERAAMALGPWDPTVGSATSYSWLFWDVSGQHQPMPPRWIPPGTRDRLWKPDDAAKYGRLQPMPLFPDDDGEVL